MNYKVVEYQNNYIVTKNDTPLSLKGVGLLIFDTKQDAQDYIKLVNVSAYYISQGIPE